jgi:hypothetical protein
MSTDERLPSQIEAEAEALRLIEEAQSFQNNPPQYEVEARQRQINEAWAKAHPPSTPAPAQAPSISPEAFASVRRTFPEGDFVHEIEEEAPRPRPSMVLPTISPYWLGRLLGQSDYSLRYGGQLRSWRKR